MPDEPIPPTEPKHFAPHFIYGFWAVCGATLTLLLVVLFGSGDKSTMPKAATVSPPPNMPKQVQVVTLFDCQYMSFSDPFFILHLPQCSNCAAKHK